MRGGSTRPARLMEKFCEMINYCQLLDLGYIGQDYTWSRQFESKGWIRGRLDKALVSTN